MNDWTDLQPIETPPTEDDLKIVCPLPNGFTLYREPNEVGGYRYWSDEVGGGVMVWDTCLTASGTLLAAIVEEERRSREVSYAGR